MSDQPKCRDCLSPMPAGAVKCASCGAFQNWRRHFTLTATAVSFFLGAAAVGGIVKGPIEDMLRPETDVRIERVGVTANGYTVFIENAGSAPGVVKYVNAFFGEKYVHLEDSMEDRVIRPGESRVVTLAWPENVSQPTHENLDFSRRTVDGEIIQRCYVMFSIFAREERWIEIDEHQSDGRCLGDFVDFLTGMQSVG